MTMAPGSNRLAQHCGGAALCVEKCGIRNASIWIEHYSYPVLYHTTSIYIVIPSESIVQELNTQCVASHRQLEKENVASTGEPRMFWISVVAIPA